MQQEQHKREKKGWVAGPTDVVEFEKEKMTLLLEGGGNDDNIVEKNGWKITPSNQLEVGKRVVCT